MYISLDLETSGLDWTRHKVLEIGAVVDYPHRPIMECPAFERVIFHSELKGEPIALAMNAGLLSRMPEEGVLEERAWRQFRDFIFTFNEDGGRKFNWLGQQVGSFDVQFLMFQMPNYEALGASHRMLDVGSMYAKQGEDMKSMGDLGNELARKCGITGNPHEALYDARVTLAMARYKWNGDVE